MSDADRGAALLRRWNECGWYRTVGMRVTRADEAGSEMALEVTPALLQAYGTAHGGAVAGLIDAAMGLAILGRLPGGEGCATVEMKLNFTAPAPPGTLRARGRVLHEGRRTVVAAAEAEDAEGRMVACGQGTFQRFAEPAP
ncbi:PaaI family thioesterase [Miltoncostaea marina]|uniref:PaaI family thioesterase n=1 Tax=Miltoncostaea marina TaxID=2843215 RepID=UPI001C3D5A07|nr:PaaI family thioesterase [Miltoncostaea marina]